MVNIKKFIDKVTSTEGRQVKDLILPLTEAKALRDEIVKLMADNYELKDTKSTSNQELEIQINGGKW